MGTRSLTFVHDDDEIVCNMYRQFDGYPSGHGDALFTFLQPIKLVNGLMYGEDPARLANGMGCLAAQMVAHFKDGPGGIYLYSPTSQDCGQDYEYHVHGGFDRRDLNIIVLSYGDKLFEGNVEAFGVWCNKPEEEE